MKILKDKFNRVHDYLRISLTDKCNLNCLYCNPANSNYKHLLKSELLTYDELIKLVKIFVQELGIKKIRFTGGEPLVRKDVSKFFAQISNLKQKYDFEAALTTNGTLLKEYLIKFKMFGIDRLNVSLDTLNKHKFKLITGHDSFSATMEAIIAAEQLNFLPLKINSVIMKGINDDEILDFVEFIKDKKMNIRFIEFMPFQDNHWDEKFFISSTEIKSVIEKKYELKELLNKKAYVAKDYEISRSFRKS